MRRALVVCTAVEAGCARVGRLAVWLLIPLVLVVAATVAAAALRVNELADWGVALPVLGDRLTMNGLVDLQWHLFLALVVLGGVDALVAGAHVRVDVLAARFGRRGHAIVRLAGDLVFLLPACVLLAWYGWDFAMTARTSGEASSYGGLADRWLIKAILPLGFALLAATGAARIVRSAIELARPELADGGTADAGGRPADTPVPIAPAAAVVPPLAAVGARPVGAAADGRSKADAA